MTLNSLLQMFLIQLRKRVITSPINHRSKIEDTAS